MDITDPNSPIFVIWIFGTVIAGIGALIWGGVSILFFTEHYGQTDGSSYHARRAKEEARAVLKATGALFLTWAWPAAVLVGGVWMTGALLRAAELPTPLSMYRARQQAKIEQLLADARERELERVERERYVDSLERQLGVGEYAA